MSCLLHNASTCPDMPAINLLEQNLCFQWQQLSRNLKLFKPRKEKMKQLPRCRKHLTFGFEKLTVNQNRSLIITYLNLI